MTIKEWICQKEAESSEKRLEQLIQIGAPQIMIDCQRKAVQELHDGILKVGGASEKLEIEVKTAEIRKGRGGKPYIIFNGSINYFPVAQYGRFIK